jgi:hypothetical protein
VWHGADGIACSVQACKRPVQVLCLSNIMVTRVVRVHLATAIQSFYSSLVTSARNLYYVTVHAAWICSIWF